ncbi:NIPSNAP family protein [Flavobacteriaceae bacterium 3-367]
MKYLSFLLLLCLVACKPSNKSKMQPTATEAMPADEMTDPVFFELRTYYAAPNKLNALLKRFEDHTLKIFEKNGMLNMGYWTPIENTENKLVYLLGYESKGQRDSAWASFRDDPEWKQAYANSIVEGKLVDSVDQLFLNYTDYSPPLKKEDKGPRVFSLRTYYTHTGKLDNLNARFKDHTLDIFTNNGMTNIAYFDLDEGQEGFNNTLVYLISFPDTLERKEAWKRFGEDPNWKSAYANSRKDGPLVDSLVHVLLNPTSFSPLK